MSGALPDVKMTDLGASLSARLGVKLTDDVGRPVRWIADSRTEVVVG